MNLLIRSAKIVDPNSAHNGKTADILIKNGKVESIRAKISGAGKVKEVSISNLYISPGWVDIGAFLGDPGFEFKEDINSGSRAAASGGFTHVCCLPNTQPAIHSKSEVEYVQAKSNGNVVSITPLGALSKNCAGEEITEMYDMHAAGVNAFTDGFTQSFNAGFMQRSLQYVKPFNGLVVSFPNDLSIAGPGTMNEGPISTLLGLKGIPALAETLAVKRDLQLAEYTDSKVHFAGISTLESVDLITEARKRGVNATCSVAVHNLVFNDSELIEYDSNFKVMPPLREENEVEALRTALSDGRIDAIHTAHLPQNDEGKTIEFDHAEFGCISFESAFGLVNKALRKYMRIGKLVDKFAVQPRKILGIACPVVERGSEANFTLFNPSEKWTFTNEHIRSKSKNTPVIDREMVGKPIGIINNSQLYLN